MGATMLMCQNPRCKHAEGFHDKHGCLVLGCHCTAYIVSETDHEGHVRKAKVLGRSFELVAPSARL